MVEIAQVKTEESTTRIPSLAEILRDAVDGGASIGFLPPLSQNDAEAHWREVFELVLKCNRILLVARANGDVVGTVQLNLETRANQRHRADVRKLIVHSVHRRKGIAKLLMHEVEAAARKANRTTLVLDTRVGDDAEVLYQKLGWQSLGIIPNYAANADGTFDPTRFMYKLLDD